MVQLHRLEAFDALIRLGSADQMRQRYGISEASTSRYRRRCLPSLGLSMVRDQREWDLIGDPTLLMRERQVHQEAHWRACRPLRMPAAASGGHLLGAPLLRVPSLPGWVLGLCYAVGVQRIAQLLEQRIVDALLIGLPDQPQPPTSARLTVARADTGVGRLCRFCNQRGRGMQILQIAMD